MPLPILSTVIVSGVSTLTASGATMLFVGHESDLARSGGIVGILIAAVGAATVAHYRLMDRRLRRAEALMTRMVICERAVLDALSEDPGPPGSRSV